MNEYILAIDQGTSSCRALLFDKYKNVVAISQKEFKQYYPQPGWVEQNPFEILNTQIEVIKQLLALNQINPTDIKAVGITNQRETTIIWDKITGIPVYNAIVWQDRRGAEVCNTLKNKGFTEQIKRKTGLVIDSYFSATKIQWIMEHVPGAKQLANKGQLAFGTVDTWLIWQLSKGKYHITDYSNASRTMLFDINTISWSDELLQLFQVHESMMPLVVNSSGFCAETDASFFGSSLPITGIAGDQQAALFGQNCMQPGMVKNTYGTGCFMLMNTGMVPVFSQSGLLTTIAWGINNKIEYALEGSVFMGGAAVKWLRDSLQLIKSADETNIIAQSLESTDGVYVVPAFAGMGAPYWDMNARGVIFGLTQGSTNKHIIRATLESIAYQSTDLLHAMISDSGINLVSMNVDGGASANDFLMQFQSNITNAKVIRPLNIETTALGAAKLAGLGAGIWTMKDITDNEKTDRIFYPQCTNEQRNMLYAGWKNAVKRTLTN